MEDYTSPASLPYFCTDMIIVELKHHVTKVSVYNRKKTRIDRRKKKLATSESEV